MDTQTLASQLSRRLQALGMTQHELATRTGLTPASISRYLSGERTPNALTLARIAGELGTTMEYLTGSPEPPARDTLDDAVQLVARSAHELTDEQKQEIVSALLKIGSTNA